MILVHGGRIIDGTGAEAFEGDLVIEGERIRDILPPGGFTGEAEEAIDAAGRFVSPGFIDIHSHADLDLLSGRAGGPKVMQGITTEAIGQCGLGAAPLTEGTAGSWRTMYAGVWGSFDEIQSSWAGPGPEGTFGRYLDLLDSGPLDTNACVFIGHGTIRQAILDEPTGPLDMERTERIIDECFDAGAFGISTGLFYYPARAAGREEISFLLSLAGRAKGIFSVHLRSEGDLLLESLDEIIEACPGPNAPRPFVEISHLKAAGRRNFGKTEYLLDKIDAAELEAGIEIGFDSYPYDVGSTTLLGLLPPFILDLGIERLIGALGDPATRGDAVSAMERGLPSWENYFEMVGPERIYITSVFSEANKELEGRSIADIASMRGARPAETVLDLVVEERGRATMRMEAMSEESVETILSHPKGAFGTDGLYGGLPHPRLTGASARLLGRYVREKRLIPIEEAVRKMTHEPARRLGLTTRGILRPGLVADIVVFDPASMGEEGTYRDPWHPPRGLEAVIVGGKAVVVGGRHTGARGGRLLRAGSS